MGNTSSDTKPNAVTVVRHNHSSQNSKERRPHDETDSPSDIRTSHKVTPKLNAQLVSSPPSLNSPPVGLVPFHDRRGSAVSYDSNSLSCSNENVAGQQTTADEILISGSLSEIPFGNSSARKIKFVDTSWGAHKTEQNDSHELNGTEGFSEYSPTWQNLNGVQNGEINPPLNAQPQNSEFEYAHRELNFISEDPEPDGMEWYRDGDEGAFADFSLAQDNSRSEELQSSASDTNFLSLSTPRRRTGRTVSQSSLERQQLALGRRSSGGYPLRTHTALTSSMSALDQPFPRSQGSQGSHGRNKSKSTELGKIKLKKKGKKSLEVLTRIGSDEHVRRYSTETERRLKRHRSDENAHRVVRLSAPEVGIPDPWVSKPLAPITTPTHGIMGESDSTSQLSGSFPPPQGQLSGQSEEQKMSGDSGSTTRSTSDIGGSNIPVRGRRSGKSYQSQRAQLHKSRSRVEGEGAVGERPKVRRKSSSGGDNSEAMEPRRLRRAKGRSLTSSPPAEEAPQEIPPSLPRDQVLSKVGEVHQEVDKVDEVEEKESPKTHLPKKLVPTPPTVERPTLIEPQHSEKESNEAMKRESRTVRERPMSATESSPYLRRHITNLASGGREHRQSLDVPCSRHKLTHSVEVPLLSESSRRIPLCHAHSAQTPYGEISIDDAIRASQGLSPMRAFSVDSGVVVSAANISPPPQQMYGGEGWKRQLYANQVRKSTLTTVDELVEQYTYIC